MAIDYFITYTDKKRTMATIAAIAFLIVMLSF